MTGGYNNQCYANQVLASNFNRIIVKSSGGFVASSRYIHSRSTVMGTAWLVTALSAYPLLASHLYSPLCLLSIISLEWCSLFTRVFF